MNVRTGSRAERRRRREGDETRECHSNTRISGRVDARALEREEDDDC